MRVEEQFLYPLFFCFALRTRTAATTLAKSTLLVASTTTSTSAMSTIPTAAFSPDNDWIARDDYVLYVDLDGSLGDVYDVERSYGSPGNGDMHSFNIYVNGDILKGGYAANIFRSYG